MMDFQIDKKKMVALFGLVVISVALGFAIYTLFFKTKLPEKTAPLGVATGSLTRSSANESAGNGGTAEGAPATEGGLPSAGEHGVANALANAAVTVTPLVTTANSAPTLGSDGKSVQYYDQLSGKFYRIDASGNKILMSDQNFPAVQNIAWAPNKTNAVIEFPDGNKVIYDFAQKKQFSVPQHWTDLSFSGDSAHVVGKTVSPDPSQQFLFSARPDGTGATPIEELGNNGDKVIVNWSPNDQVVAFSKTGPPLPGNGERQSILMIGKNHENFRALTVEGLGFEPQWSPKGDRILYSAFSSATGMSPTLWIDGGTNESVGAAKNYLNVNTWAHKCTFMNNNEILCAVPNPEKLVPGIGFAPDLATDTDDTIYKINIKTGLQLIVAKPTGNRTIQHIDISADGHTMFLKDQNSGDILKMELK